MKNSFVRCLTAAAAAVLTGLMIFPSYAATIITGVNLVNARQNVHGDGYTWDNPNSTLTLDSLNIDTDADFGLKIPTGARVILKGDSYIRAGKYGIGVQGNVSFEGEGTLTVEASDAAIYSYSTSDNHKLRFMSGSYELTGGECGILSDAAEISVVGGNMTLSPSGDKAIDGRTIRLTGGSIIADASIYASHLIDVDRTALEVTADAPALVADGQIKLSNMEIKVGDSADELSEADMYSGENVISTVPCEAEGRRSILFGDNVSANADYLILAAAILVVVACIVGPIVVKNRRRRRLYERLGRLPDGSMPKNFTKK